jgi:ABC-2 type transport system permease protein
MSAIAIPRGASRGSWFALRAVANETAKGIALMWHRRATLAMGTATNGVMYLMIQFFIGAGHINHAVLAVTLPGLVAYAVASTAALSGAGGIAEEVNGGTLEQAHLSPARPSLLALGRVGALAAEGLIAAVVLAAAYWAGFGVHYTIRPDALVPLLLLLADARVSRLQPDKIGHHLHLQAEKFSPGLDHVVELAGEFEADHAE